MIINYACYVIGPSEQAPCGLVCILRAGSDNAPFNWHALSIKFQGD